MTQQRKREIGLWVLIGALGLLGFGMMVAYSVLETELQELQTVYNAEQAKTKKLAQEVDGLSKTVEQAQARVKTLERKRRASEQDKRKLRAKATIFNTGLQAEQAKTKELTQRADGFLQAVDKAQARVKALEKSRRALEREKRQQRAKATKLERALRGLQTAYASEQAKTKKLTEKVAGLSKAVEQAQAGVKGKGPEKSTGVPELEKGRLQAKATKPETSHQELQTTYKAEPAKTEKLTREMAPMLELVTRLRAELVALHHALGVSYNRLGMNEEALKEFQTALELNPDHADSHFDMARVYIEYSDDSASAAPHFRKYVQLRPEASDTERVKGWLMKVEKELEAKHNQKHWEKREGFFQALHKIFF